MMVPKFRAWDKIDSEYIDEINAVMSLDGSHIWWDIHDSGEMEYEDNPDNYELEQSTGLKDANGKEIYEGDVVHFRSDCLSGLGIVKWNETGGAWEVEDIRSRTNKRGHRIYPIYPQAKYRIDGNVHENPELLEAQHE